MHKVVQTHYDAFLAGCYSWISGGAEEQVRKNRYFFSSHGITAGDNPVAIDLGAGCGFHSVPLAGLGYSVTAVDFCGSLLDELRSYAGDLPIQTIQSDILNFSSWSGRHPALIICMGDTLTHLPAPADVEDLIRQCYSELNPGGRLVLSLRDYSREPEGGVAVIPVMRSEDRIFLCRLEYHADTITVQDILYSSGQGFWERTAGNYTKIRVAPEILTRMLNRTGFRNEYSAVNNGMIEVFAQKGA
jgi:SAM-dependent methyltransferase